ncbi:MAG: hypothetical protein HUU21_32630 [Polyangiaceae bacterium]|nr:hypothetical protein [Polyangiaceae bacterium]NUQ78300.1 hypothetical protein [Polyangiaceae bacterium]
MRFSGVFILVLVGLLGCGGGGYSNDEAKQVCDLEANKPCSNAETTAQCISCYEECGADCAVLESCPVQYACSAD